MRSGKYSEELRELVRALLHAQPEKRPGCAQLLKVRATHSRCADTPVTSPRTPRRRARTREARTRAHAQKQRASASHAHARAQAPN